MLNNFFSSLNKNFEDKNFSFWETPWKWRTDDGIYFGRSKDAWIYREFPLNPLTWEDPVTRISSGDTLNRLLMEFGYSSKDFGGGIASLSYNREIHIISLTWEDSPQISRDITPELREYLISTLDFLLPRRSVLIGIKLKSSLTRNISKKSQNSIKNIVKNLATNILQEDVPSVDPYQDDINFCEDIFRRNGCYVPKNDVMKQLESWYNNGKGQAVEIYEAKDVIYIDGEEKKIELAALQKFNRPINYAPNFEWMLSATSHRSGTKVISIRGELEPSTVTRARSRRSQRKLLGQMEEERATQDLEKLEDTELFNLAQTVENFFVNNPEPLLTNCSIVMARLEDDSDETYIDELRNNFSIDVTPLIHRQMPALEETLPCSKIRVNPFIQDLSVGMISYGGIQGFSNLGDEKGILLGLVDPDFTACWLDINAAPRMNKPPAMGIFGDPGSGKTFAAQLIAAQAKMNNHQVIFLNPKPHGTLSPFADFVGGKVIKMSELESKPGFFDPFKFAPPNIAAEIATSFILSVLGNIGVAGYGLTPDQEMELGAAMKKAASVGVKCVGDALKFIEDIRIRKQIYNAAKTYSLFSLGISDSSQNNSYEQFNGLVLIEFDRKPALPDTSKPVSSYTIEERVALAAIRLVTKASMEILAKSGGGVFILDEAWTFLSSRDGISTIQQMGREGRSLNLLPIFITQRVADLIKEGIDMESYISRALVMKLTDENEARAALKLCRLEATDTRISWLRNIGPRKGKTMEENTPAWGLFRDINERHAAVMIGPTPRSIQEAFTTNPEERAELDIKNSEEL